MTIRKEQTDCWCLEEIKCLYSNWQFKFDGLIKTQIYLLIQIEEIYMKDDAGRTDTEIVIASYDIMKQSCGSLCPYIEGIQVKGQYTSSTSQRISRSVARRALDMIRGFTKVCARSEAETGTS